MNGQPDLPGMPPYAAGSDTSKEAAESMVPNAGTLRRKVLELIASSKDGLTCDEIEVRTGLAHQTASARVWELHTSRQIIDSGMRRVTRRGRRAAVWKVNDERRHSSDQEPA